MIRYTLLTAFLAVCLAACSESSNTESPASIEETPEAIEAAHEEMTKEVKSAAEAMTEEVETKVEPVAE